MHRDSAHGPVRLLDLTGMDAHTHLETEPPHASRNGLRAADRASRSLEGREKAVAGRVDLLTRVAAQLLADEHVVALDKPAPGVVSQPGCGPGGVDDVGEHQRREDTVDAHAGSHG